MNYGQKGKTNIETRQFSRFDSEAIERNFLIETRSLPLSLAVTLTALCHSSRSLHSSFIALTLRCLALGRTVLDVVHFFKVAVLRPNSCILRPCRCQNNAIGHRKFFVVTDLGGGNGQRRS